jgi:hypothetical protein
VFAVGDVRSGSTWMVAPALGKAGWLSESSQNIWLGPRVRVGSTAESDSAMLLLRAMVSRMSITSTVVQRADIQFHEAPEALRRFVGCFWVVTADRDATIRIVPDGTTSISILLQNNDIGGLMIRLSWPAYASVEAAMAFTLPMLIARLSISAVATLGAGLVTAVIAPRSMRALLMTGVILLVAFIPVHIGLLDKFPVWYHLTFLLSLVPLIYLGGRITWRGSTVGRAMTAVPGIQR